MKLLIIYLIIGIIIAGIFQLTAKDYRPIPSLIIMTMWPMFLLMLGIVLLIVVPIRLIKRYGSDSIT